KSKVYGLLLPEHDSSRSSADLGAQVAQQLGIAYRLEHIGPTLEAIGCYRWRDEAMCAVFPDYAPGWKSKIAIAGGAQGRMNFFKLVVQSPAGEVFEKRLPAREYLQIVSATNYKQRIRKTVEYFHADRLNYAVIGTPNRLEYDQGFFVKLGDGAADIKPIAHLYKSQVYALAEYVGVPEDIRRRPPTTDTFSLPQTQEEFYFALPYPQMDLCLYGRNHGVPAGEVAAAAGLTAEQVARVYKDIDQKRRTTAYLHARPLLAELVPEIKS
ncbi:MAG: NAD(+) synthase, partial [Acidobacteriota bacterium]|nr:NAD(+) synthase [Acidobacteriota bacterium]